MRSARWSGCRRRRSIRSARPTTTAGLRPAEQLVAAEADEVGAGGERVPRGRLVGDLDERARAEVVEQRHAVRGARPRRAPPAIGRSVKPTTRKFDWWTRRSSAVSPVRPRARSRGARAVRRADLDERRARAREHVGDAEAVADLDQLAARDEHLASFGERGEREQHRGGVVVDDDRRLGAGQPPQDRRDVILARAARAFGEVVLEVRVAAGDLGDALARGGWRAARGRGWCARSRRSRSGRGGAPGGAPRSARRAGAPARSPGSPPARISARALGEHLRAASTASGSSLRASRARRPRADREAPRETITSSPARRPLLHCQGEARFSSPSAWSLLAAVGAAVARALQYRGAAKPGVQRARDRRRRRSRAADRGGAAPRGRRGR